MRVTTKGRYALRATLALARMADGTLPTSIKTISAAEGISPEFLEQIFFKLRKAGIIASVRGPGGGFYFAKPLESITLKHILTASGEGLGIAPCLCDADELCINEDHCVASALWKKLSKHMDEFLDSQNLANILLMPPEPKSQ